MALTDRPIPGQSLTTPPRQFPYERPPDMVNPLEALDVHIERLNEKDNIADVMTALENGIDLVTLVEGILRSAVMAGVHGLDTSMIIAPHMHEFIKGEADFVGIDYEEGFVDKEATEKNEKRRLGAMVRKRMRDETADNLEETRLVLDVPAEETPDMPEEPQQEQKGLMSRPAPEETEELE